MEAMDLTESVAAAIPAIGIDLGTTNCCVGVYHNGEVQIIRNRDDGGPTTSSYVFIGHDGETVTVGKPAKDNAFKDPQNTIYDAKRILGRTFSDPELQKDITFWPFTVEEHEGVPKVNVNGKRFYPEEISGRLLKKLKSGAEKQLKLDPGSITKAVITVPAYFNDGQRQATIDAGELAGFKDLQILNEPTAAAIAYFLKELKGRVVNDRKVLVFDLGGGTFDVAVLEMKSQNIAVLGVSGDTHLGGEDFDKKIVEFCVSTFNRDEGVDLFKRKVSRDTRARLKARRNLRRLQTYCENGKQFLTGATSTSLSMDALYYGKDLDVKMSREEFENLNKDNFQKTIDLVDETLRNLMLTKDDIDDVVLVGGSTRIPKIQALLKNYFGGKMLDETIDPDQSVAYGAAIQAAKMTGINLVGQIEEVTPMSVGVEVNGKTFSVVIPKSTKIPTKKDHTYATKDYNQTTASIKIYQGEDKQAANNKLLGEFVLEGIPRNKAAREKLKVMMEITSMGILHVSAVCMSNQMSNELTVVEKKGRMDEELKKKLREKLMQSDPE